MEEEKDFKTPKEKQIMEKEVRDKKIQDKIETICKSIELSAIPKFKKEMYQLLSESPKPGEKKERKVIEIENHSPNLDMRDDEDLD